MYAESLKYIYLICPNMFVNMDASSNVEFNDNHNSNTVMVGYQKKQFI